MVRKDEENIREFDGSVNVHTSQKKSTQAHVRKYTTVFCAERFCRKSTKQLSFSSSGHS